MSQPSLIFVGCLVTALLIGGCGKPTPTVALTFDEYETTYSKAFPIMKNRGLVGTFFVNPILLERGILRKDQLDEMRGDGWSIQAYSGTSMVRLLESEGRDATKARLIEIRDRMKAQGFSVTALAAGSRQWNDELRDLADGVYSTVRVSSHGKFQEYPFPDPLYVKYGGPGASLSSDDTIDGFSRTLESLQKTRDLWIVVVHKVGDTEDPMYSISSDTFAAFCDLIAAEVEAGRLRVITFR